MVGNYDIFRGNWGDKADVAESFNINLSDLDDCEFLYAWYSYEDYSGSAQVLFKKDGKLYEVNGGHCSCYGLEGQFEPEETTVEALRLRSGYNAFPEEVLNSL